MQRRPAGNGNAGSRRRSIGRYPARPPSQTRLSLRARSSADLDPAAAVSDRATAPAAAGLVPAPDLASASAAADPDCCLLSLSWNLSYPPRASLKRAVVCPGSYGVARRHGCSSSSPTVARCARCGRLRSARPVVPADSRARPLGARLPDRVGRNRARSRSAPVVRPLVVAGQLERAYRGGGFRVESAALVFPVCESW
jgi:hypothetical protein